MSQIVVISGHPNLDESNTNKLILEQLEQQVDGVEIRQLDRLYPDYEIDVEAEQAALLKADIIVLQFPFYWYSVPGLLKKWVDDVFAYNFAYGSKGDKLKGKDFLLSFTIGGPTESYEPLGYNHFTIEQLVPPLQQTAYLTGMTYHPPVYSHGMIYIPEVYNTLEDVQHKADDHAGRLVKTVKQLANSPENRIRKFVKKWFQRFDQLPDNTDFFTQGLSEDSNLKMPEGEFFGHSGFRDWYAMAKQTFKPDCDHQLEQISIRENTDDFQVNLRVRLLAETFEDSALGGQSVDMLVDETWSVFINDSNQLQISDYEILPVTA